VRAWSAVSDFHFRGGNLSERGLDVGGLNVEDALPGGGEPCVLSEQAEQAGVAFAGLREQVDGGRSEDVALQPGASYVPVEVIGDGFFWQWPEAGGGGDPAQQRSLDAEFEAVEKVVVSEQDQAEGASGPASEAEQQAQFLECGSGVVLRVVEDEHEGERFDPGEVLFECEQVGRAFEAAAFAEFGQQRFENAGEKNKGQLNSCCIWDWTHTEHGS